MFQVTVLRLLLGAIALQLSGCGASPPAKDEATLKREAAEIDKKVKDGESGL